ncbi:RNA-directed DNA polymerase, eukaryota [Tanacetum coccineum]|uniref:RNA-directed DNA polymerase, eukaryota n=1 Tax=Tanacetum coccineum TaxID=301880 RepID=A0ABQ5AST2_9ASTR
MHGFYDNITVSEQVHSLSSKLKEMKLNDEVSSHHSMNSRPLTSKECGSILDVIEEIIKVGQTMGYNMQCCLGNKTKKGWIKELCHKHRINFLAIQETKLESIDLFSIKSLWGNLNFDHVVGPSVRFFDSLFPTSTKLLILSVYTPQELTEKCDLWNYLRSLIDRWDGETVIMGYFNEVRYEHERFGSTFNSQGANVFNNFISLAGLIDLPLEVNGEWISNPVGVKREFYSYFKNQFSPSYTPRLSFDFVFPNRLSTDQVEDLERLVTYDEVKRAVWDYGANKSPRPDGFTFEFFYKFWKTLDQDVFQAV